ALTRAPQRTQPRHGTPGWGSERDQPQRLGRSEGKAGLELPGREEEAPQHHVGRRRTLDGDSHRAEALAVGPAGRGRRRAGDGRRVLELLQPEIVVARPGELVAGGLVFLDV